MRSSRIRTISVKIFDARAHAFRCSPAAISWRKDGRKAFSTISSPRILLKRVGTVKAMANTSVARLAPKNDATTTSLKKPNTLESRLPRIISKNFFETSFLKGLSDVFNYAGEKGANPDPKYIALVKKRKSTHSQEPSTYFQNKTSPRENATKDFLGIPINFLNFNAKFRNFIGIVSYLSMRKEVTMPIYEYRCKACGKKSEFLTFSVNEQINPHCKYCGSEDVVRLLSRVRVILSEETRLESLADPSKLGSLDENDPKSMAKFLKKMGREFGDELGDEFGGDIDEIVEEAMEEETKSKEKESEDGGEVSAGTDFD